ncbi:MAG: hypothetical protein ABJO36_00925 [Litorimonas sp.]
MSPVQISVLSLVAATIFADKRIYASEIEVFIKATGNVNALKGASPKLTEARLLEWYETHGDTIRQKITAPYFKDWFYDLLEQLSDVADKHSILEVMEKISVADGSVHVSERALVTLAKRFWGMS